MRQQEGVQEKVGSVDCLQSLHSLLLIDQKEDQEDLQEVGSS
jgi:hypothetical protein